MTADLLAGLAVLLLAVGAVQAAAGAVLVARFAWAAIQPAQPARNQPPISVLKPLHGDEPLLEQALASVCTQEYPAFQVVFGVKDEADAALAAVNRLRARFPRCDIAVVVDPAEHGANRKVGNLINMLPAARYDVLVIADSDLHVLPDYLTRLAEALDRPGTGLITTLYTGLPAASGWVQKLGATHITHTFLPGALLARAMGRQDCLGATMVLRRTTLAQIGGFQALASHLADDQVLGRLVAGLGLAVRLAATVPATTVPEATLRGLLRHELRWARTIRAVEPGPYAASILQYPLFWGLLAILLSGGAAWAFGAFFLAWVGRAFAATSVDRALEPLLTQMAKPWESSPPGRHYREAQREAKPDAQRDVRRGDEPRSGRSPGDLRLDDGADPDEVTVPGLAFPCPVWLLPLRDLMSAGVMLLSYAGRRVEWRGHHQIADTPGRPPGSKGLRPR